MLRVGTQESIAIAKEVKKTMFGEQKYAIAPRWLQEAEAFNGWYPAWTDEIIRERLPGFPVIVRDREHDAEWIQKAHLVSPLRARMCCDKSRRGRKTSGAIGDDPTAHSGAFCRTWPFDV